MQTVRVGSARGAGGSSSAVLAAGSAPPGEGAAGGAAASDRVSTESRCSREESAHECGQDREPDRDASDGLLGCSAVGGRSRFLPRCWVALRRPRVSWFRLCKRGAPGPPRLRVLTERSHELEDGVVGGQALSRERTRDHTLGHSRAKCEHMQGRVSRAVPQLPQIGCERGNAVAPVGVGLGRERVRSTCPHMHTGFGCSNVSSPTVTLAMPQTRASTSGSMSILVYTDCRSSSDLDWLLSLSGSLLG